MMFRKLDLPGKVGWVGTSKPQAWPLVIRGFFFCAAQLATTKQNKNFVFCFALSLPFTIFAESKSADE
ncbi:MAG: hypothetical protein IJK08_05075 [Prevotella sp.]|nr:hypothetical protein [Prevotella sp.]